MAGNLHLHLSDGHDIVKKTIRYSHEYLEGASGVVIAPSGAFALVTHGGRQPCLAAWQASLSSSGDDDDDDDVIPGVQSCASGPQDLYSIARIDLDAGDITFPYIGLDAPPSGIAIAPSGAFALVTIGYKVARIDLVTGSVTFPYTFPYFGFRLIIGVAIAPTGSFALVMEQPTTKPQWHNHGKYKSTSNFPGELVRVDLCTGEVTRPYKNIQYTKFEVAACRLEDGGVAIAADSTFALVTGRWTKKPASHSKKPGKSNKHEPLSNVARIGLSTGAVSPPYPGVFVTGLATAPCGSYATMFASSDGTSPGPWSWPDRPLHGKNHVHQIHERMLKGGGNLNRRECCSFAGCIVWAGALWHCRAPPRVPSDQALCMAGSSARLCSRMR